MKKVVSFKHSSYCLISLPSINSVGASSAMWSQKYGGNYDDCAYSLVETSDGGYALAGEMLD